jgi:hypothetical protein
VTIAIVALRCALFACALSVVLSCSDGKASNERQVPPTTTQETQARQAVSDSASARDTSTTPAVIVRRYYDAIRAGNYIAAYGLWSDDGKASGQTLDAFASGFANTAEVGATVSDNVTIEGAAGSQYATVPVVVHAVTRNGEKQLFTGTYTLRRAMVDGATPEQRRWRIYSAAIGSR